MKIYLLKVENMLIIPKSYISQRFNTISKKVMDIVLLLMQEQKAKISHSSYLTIVFPAFFVHRECIVSTHATYLPSHAGNEIWGIDATWRRYSKLRNKRHVKFIRYGIIVELCTLFYQSRFSEFQS